MEINKNVITMSQVLVPEPERREKPPVLTTNTIQAHEFPRGEKPAGPGSPMITTENVDKMRNRVVVPASEKIPVVLPSAPRKAGRPKKAEGK